jgi:hypothetical protein
MTAKRKVVGSNLVTDDFSTCNPTYLQLWALWIPGRNPGEGVKLGSNPRKADENHSLSYSIKSNQSTLAAKRTVISLFFFFFFWEVWGKQIVVVWTDSTEKDLIDLVDFSVERLVEEFDASLSVLARNIERHIIVVPKTRQEALEASTVRVLCNPCWKDYLNNNTVNQYKSVYSRTML